MIDFKLTENGDISLDTVIRYRPFQLRFTTGTYPKQCIWFDIRQETKIPRPDNSFCISFITEDTETDPVYMVSSCQDFKEKIQALKIRLRTELGEITDFSTFGSSMELTKHKDLRDQATLDAIQSEVYDVVSQIMDTIGSVEVKAESADKTTGYFYCQNINVYLYDTEGIEIYRFDI